MSNAICGKDGTVSGLTGVTNVSTYTLTLEGNEFDTTVIGDGTFGSVTICGAKGSLELESYDYCTDDIGADITFSANVGSTTFSAACVIQSKTVGPVDAKGIVVFKTVARLTGDLTGE